MNNILNNNTSKEILIKGGMQTGKTTVLIEKLIYRMVKYKSNSLLIVKDQSECSSVYHMIKRNEERYGFITGGGFYGIFEFDNNENDKLYVRTFNDMKVPYKLYCIRFFTIGIDNFELFDKNLIGDIAPFLSRRKLPCCKQYLPAQIVYSLGMAFSHKKNEELKEFATKFKDINTLNLKLNQDKIDELMLHYKEIEYKNEFLLK